MKVYEIDGRNFNDINGFYEEITTKILTECQESWGRNLDALNDVLSGGFGTPDEGFILVWSHPELSKKALTSYHTPSNLAHPR